MANKNHNKKAVIEEVTEEIPVEVEEVIDEVPVEVEDVTEEVPVEVEDVQNDKYVKVNAAKLNIRANCDKDSEVLTIVEQNQLLKLIEPEIVNGFYHVDTLTGFEGYCMEMFVEIV